MIRIDMQFQDLNSQDFKLSFHGYLKYFVQRLHVHNHEIVILVTSDLKSLFLLLLKFYKLEAK